ncbi:NAD(P)-dependent oxidoreductase [Paenibacillus sp. R14(2021)]|uniref:NAD(P)-dependent oxidoreductase n=1 Tax=Paenibacillus sp. R14(2021) TaxID=2859228 RepID=UPI001C615F13|nr:NAD(P)H-binding protein [Paenibacillus sp. R14(2021)]
MKIVVFGASGGTGKQVVQQALEQGYAVTAFVRSLRKLDLEHQGLSIIQGDARDEAAVAQAIAGQDAVISCLGRRRFGRTMELSEMAACIIAGMKRHGVLRIGYVASAGIHKEIPGLPGLLARIVLCHVLADHRCAVDALAASGLNWTVARPVQLVGGRLKGDYKEARQGVPTGESRISRADVAHFLLRTLTDSTYSRQSVGLTY